jgi:hypothetical protein
MALSNTHLSSGTSATNAALIWDLGHVVAAARLKHPGIGMHLGNSTYQLQPKNPCHGLSHDGPHVER